ncbi:MULTISPECIES: hypothetical protein [unclassified Streptomyces]|uniref:hypothetical protein n=1 Tax=unclassified Streptomyces TaxID=2593676 RepID=UPI00225033BC|nr:MULTISPECIES: hypothetical protein [unclassified Streptomyces]MCX5287386.1 hypothetical protein [Streptomyces sp. NBC_00183]
MQEAASLDEVPKEPQIEGAILFGMRRLPPEFSDLRLPDPPRSDDEDAPLPPWPGRGLDELGVAA